VHEDRLRRIREKLDRLRSLDQRMEVFGASWGDVGHRYREEPRLMEIAVASLETALGVPLPDEYRAFVTTVHGGGAGPGYGLLPPRAEGAGRFPYGRAQAMDLLERRKGDERFAMLPGTGDGAAPGCLRLSDQGCGWEDVLVLEGEMKGTVWTAGEGFCPHANADGPIGFLDWYEGWLDANLAPGALTTDPMALGSLPADTVGVNLSGKGLVSWPAAIDRLSKLRVLVLDQNQLPALPDSLSSLGALERLSAGWNRIESLPSSLGALGALESIMLKSNALGAIPDSIGDCRSLRYACLDFNQLDRLPDSIGRLGSLRELLVSSNRLVAVPDSIGALEALEELDLSGNPIERLPDSIGSLGRLRSLSLSGHRLKRLPDSVANLRSLRRISLDHGKDLDLFQACGVLASLSGLREVSLRGLPAPEHAFGPNVRVVTA
jgi:hypothetical protein